MKYLKGKEEGPEAPGGVANGPVERFKEDVGRKRGR